MASLVRRPSCNRMKFQNITYMYVIHVYTCLMRDEKEGRKKQTRSNMYIRVLIRMEGFET